MTSFLKDLPKLLVAIVLCEAVGVAGSFFTVSSISSWYQFLVKPELSPPNWIFGPVWTILYALMGIAAFLIWKKGNTKALWVFAAQLFLNALWTPVFFGLQNPLFGLTVIVLLWLAIVATIAMFYKTSKTAAALLVPYLLWVSFATYLNYSILVLN